MRLLVLADTHWPTRAKELPQQVWHAVEEADVVIHAGDWVDGRLVDQLQERSRRLVACWGNNDGAAIRARLPKVARLELAGLRVAVVHETGPAQGRERRMGHQFPDVDLLVFGHSHIPWDSRGAGGMRLLNPGSPTDRRRQPHATYMTAELTGAGTPGTGTLQVTLHPLPRR